MRGKSQPRYREVKRLLSALLAGRSASGTSIIVISLLVACAALAQDSATIERTRNAPTDEILTPLTDSDRARADAWQLDETEWRRYRQLMQGIRGSVSDERLSPIEVLGIHARDTAERRHYARRWAEAMRADAERILAFQQAYDDAARALFKGQPLIDAGRLGSVPKTASALQPGDRVLFFTAIDCPACEAMLAKLLDHLTTVAGIDIYFTDPGANHDAAIRSWANEQGIEPRWVQARRVTLNVDNGLLASLTDDAPPALYVRRDETVTRLGYADL